MCGRAVASGGGPRWWGLYAIAGGAATAVAALEAGGVPPSVASRLELAVSAAAVLATLRWLRANRVALEQQEWCACAGDTVTIRELTPGRYTSAVDGTGRDDAASVRPAGPRWRPAGYLHATAVVAATTGFASLLAGAFEPASLIMVYFLAIVAVATWSARGPATFTVLLSVAAFDFFFVPPHYTFAVADTQYLVTFAVMLVVGLTISGLTVRIRRQAESAQKREQDTAALYAMSRTLADAGTAEEVATVAARHLGQVFSAEAAVLLPDGIGVRPCPAGDAVRLSEETLATAGWVLEHREAAGVGASHEPAGAAAYRPLLGHGGALGVVWVRPAQRRALRSAEALPRLEAFVAQTALALERVRLADEARDARVRAETERLRNALLTSVSHDLRTPLAAITGAASTMLDGGELDRGTQRELIESIREEAERLNRLVQNLLEMTRLEAGTLQLRRDWHPLEEVVGAALGRLEKRLCPRRILVDIPPELPLVLIDDVLIEQVFINLLDNALKYTPGDSPIRITATATDNGITVEVADRGPGLPRGEEDRVFEKFHRADRSGRSGAGLGLAICRGIIQAHGGRMWAHTLPEGGTAFFLRLSVVGDPPAGLPPDA